MRQYQSEFSFVQNRSGLMKIDDISKKLNVLLNQVHTLCSLDDVFNSEESTDRQKFATQLLQRRMDITLFVIRTNITRERFFYFISKDSQAPHMQAQYLAKQMRYNVDPRIPQLLGSLAESKREKQLYRILVVALLGVEGARNIFGLPKATALKVSNILTASTLVEPLKGQELLRRQMNVHRNAVTASVSHNQQTRLFDEEHLEKLIFVLSNEYGLQAAPRLDHKFLYVHPGKKNLTLPKLQVSMKNHGMAVSRSTLHRQFNSRSNNGLNILYRKPKKDLTKFHWDSHYCSSMIKKIIYNARTIPSEHLLCLSIDDKALVGAGSSISPGGQLKLWGDHYLWDHDFTRDKSKLISLSGILHMLDVSSRSGQQYYVLRPTASQPSSAVQHFVNLINLEKYHSLPMNRKIHLYFVDGGSDLRPRLLTTMLWMALQALLYDLQCIILITYAPGDSKFNMVEHAHAIVNRALSGQILPEEVTEAIKTLQDLIEGETFSKLQVNCLLFVNV